MTMQWGEGVLRGLLQAAGIACKGSYNSAEVCRILGISVSVFWRLVKRYSSTDPRPDSLDSYLIRSHRRVLYYELAAYLERNRGCERDSTG